MYVEVFSTVPIGSTAKLDAVFEIPGTGTQDTIGIVLFLQSPELWHLGINDEHFLLSNGQRIVDVSVHSVLSERFNRLSTPRLACLLVGVVVAFFAPTKNGDNPETTVSSGKGGSRRVNITEGARRFERQEKGMTRESAIGKGFPALI